MKSTWISWRVFKLAAEITPNLLAEANMLHQNQRILSLSLGVVRLLLRSTSRFSALPKSARAKIEAAGGSVELIG